MRIALNLKGLDYETVPVNLVAGEQRAPGYVAMNPIEGVPTLVLDDGTVLTQSLAIIDYLEAVAPAPALLPADPVARARVLAAAHTIAMDIHPVNNLRVGARLKSEHGLEQDDVVAWMAHWMQKGFAAYEALLPAGPTFSFGEAPGLADICLVAQLYNAHRWGVDMSPFPRLATIERAALALPAFDAARPEHQPDAE